MTTLNTRLWIALLAVATMLTAGWSLAFAQTSVAGPLSRAELLAYLRSIPKSQDFSVPYATRKAAHDKLTELIRQRGIAFAYDMSKFDKELYDAGISSESMMAMSQRYRTPEQARAPMPAAGPTPSPAPAAPSAPAPTPAPARRDTAAVSPSGSGPLSRADVLARLRSIPHYQDMSVPNQVRKEAHDALTRLIRQRGVDWVQPRGKFDKEFYDAGISTETSQAIWESYRAPGTLAPSAETTAATVSFFHGRWAMGIAGSSTRYDREGSNRVVRTDRDTGAVGGSLEISSGGTYTWRHNSTDPPIQGRWRVATPPEMGTEAGQGIVLLGGYDGGNWRVTRFPAFDRPGDHISVSDLAQPYRYFLGSR
ncbi:MAG: hypothetical protein HYZ57_21550 [Acidobacteria bacterium]|nr:hypothetical protein [Acidobacteriota bacterium]MBI3282412.1 hypothetical protein [Acidobacteriota bacterium]